MTPPTQRHTARHRPAAATDDPRQADEERARSLSREWGIPYVNLRQLHVAPELLQRVPERLLLRHRVLPIALRDGRLRLAMANPLDVQAIDETRVVTGYDVEPVVAAEQALMDTLQRCLALPARGGGSAATAAPAPQERPEAYLLDASSPQEVLSALLDAVRARGASRLFLVPQADGLAVRLRLRGAIRAEPTVPLPVADALVEHVEELAGIVPGVGAGPRQGRFPLDEGDGATEVRVASYPTMMGDALVLRLSARDDRLTGLDQLGMRADVEQRLAALLRADAGLLLVAGPAGSGRTTTLYAAVERLRAEGRAVFTVEQFIERPVPGVAQAEIDEARGLTALGALRSLVAIEPDAVLIGEVHTPAVAVLAVQLARAGSLVVAGTLGYDAASVVSHLASAELDPSLFAESLHAVVAQRVVRTLCEGCREPYEACAESLEPLRPEGACAERVTLYRAVGCGACVGGYAGRTGVFELMEPEERLRALIGARAPDEALRHAAVRTGMRPLARHALARLLAGDTTTDEALCLARDA
ncbi:MAG: GspE/PulE family protein [bacterium]